MHKLKRRLAKLLIINLVFFRTVVHVAYAQEVPSSSPTPEPIIDNVSQIPTDQIPSEPISSPTPTEEPTPPTPSPDPTISPSPESPTTPDNSTDALPTSPSNPESASESTEEPTNTPTTPSPTPDVSEALQSTPTPSPLPTLDDILSTEADINQVATASSTTGSNIGQSPGLFTMISGDALAIANVLSAINAQAQNSQLAIVSLTPTPDESGNIDLNELWRQMQASGESLITNSSQNYPLVFTIFNQADVHTIVFANADSGQNSLTAEAVDLETGTALSIANVGQLINADLFNAQVFF